MCSSSPNLPVCELFIQIGFCPLLSLIYSTPKELPEFRVNTCAGLRVYITKTSAFVRAEFAIEFVACDKEKGKKVHIQSADGEKYFSSRRMDENERCRVI